MNIFNISDPKFVFEADVMNLLLILFLFHIDLVSVALSSSMLMVYVINRNQSNVFILCIKC